MKPDLKNLRRRVRRLTVDKDRQAELTAYLKRMTEEQARAAASLMDEHDDEVLKTLDNKLREREKVHEDAMKELGAKIPDPDVDKDEFLAFISDIFSGPEAFAVFLAGATDELVAALRDVLLALVPEKTGDNVRNLFKEARLQRMAGERREGAAYKEALVRQIMKREKQISDLDRVFARVEAEIGK